MQFYIQCVLGPLIIDQWRDLRMRSASDNLGAANIETKLWYYRYRIDIVCSSVPVNVLLKLHIAQIPIGTYLTRLVIAIPNQY